MTGRPDPTDVDRFLDLAIEGHRARAARLVLDLFDRGMDAEAIITDVLVAAQRESGRRWQRGEWTVADEHMVTGSTQTALDALASALPEPDEDGPVVAVACAEGEWHSLAAQFLAELLRARGRSVHFLGPSTPAEEVARHLRQHDVSALAISCSLPLFFAGVGRVVEAAHSEGTPTIVGGRAITARHADRLGADAFDADIDALVARLEQWRTDPPLPRQDGPHVDPAVVLLGERASEIAAEAYPRLVEAHPAAGAYDERQQARTREDLAYIVRFVAAGRLVDDPEVLATFLQWLDEVLTTRGVPSAALTAGLEALLPVLTDHDPVAGQWVRAELGRAAAT